MQEPGTGCLEGGEVGVTVVGHEMTPEKATRVLEQYKRCPWVAVVRSDPRSAIMRSVRHLAQLGEGFDIGAKIKWKKK